VWQSRTGGTGQAHLVVQTDGNVVTYNNASGSPTWWTGTGGHAATTNFGSDTLAAGRQLDSQQYLRSSDKRYGLLLQSDGNLVLYNGNAALWSTWTGGTGSTHAVMQSDGNFVVYTAGNSATWQAGTNGRL
jgi:hypothetical protein